jgi:hypothetical protein
MMHEPVDVWLSPIVVAVVDAYLQQVQSLMETVRQMDSALQRRSKLRAPAAPTVGVAVVMGDSDKITLQLLLDARALGEDMQELGVSQIPPSYAVLLEELIDAERFLTKS